MPPCPYENKFSTVMPPSTTSLRETNLRKKFSIKIEKKKRYIAFRSIKTWTPGGCTYRTFCSTSNYRAAFKTSATSFQLVQHLSLAVFAYAKNFSLGNFIISKLILNCSHLISFFLEWSEAECFFSGVKRRTFSGEGVFLLISFRWFVIYWREDLFLQLKKHSRLWFKTKGQRFR